MLVFKKICFGIWLEIGKNLAGSELSSLVCPGAGCSWHLPIASSVRFGGLYGSRACLVLLLPYRNLFYTGTMRAKRLLLMIGSPSALKRAVETTVSEKRYTGLIAHMKSVFADCDIPSPFKAT